MTTYLNLIEDTRGDLVDIDYYCSGFCAPSEVRAESSWPCPDWPEYDVYCAGCGDLMHGESRAESSAVLIHADHAASLSGAYSGASWYIDRELDTTE